MTENAHPEARDAAGGEREPPSELVHLVHTLLGRLVRDLRVEIRGGGLVLRGRADSDHARQLARHAAVAASGLPLSANEIVVTDARGETPPAGPDPQ